MCNFLVVKEDVLRDAEAVNMHQMGCQSEVPEAGPSGVNTDVWEVGEVARKHLGPGRASPSV